ncbi:MAG: hypothetical protein JXQ69_09405 [Paludibacteraceae bacterium]|nr:hypothetical protein [Paludibacteraceae bacterium]MBN2788522.1 hypothetical protein [Paludibacteraceae bacterium]
MKLKKTFLTMLIVGLSVSSFAQLSQRTNDSGNFKFGTRPQAGDMGVNLQFYSPFDGSDVNFGNYFKSVPIVNLQYYLSDDTALRFGIRASKDLTLFEGEENIDTTSTSIKNGTEKNSSGEYMIYLGAEKHFALTNLLDVYLGAQLPLGYQFSTTINDQDLNNGDYNHSTVKERATLYGLECFVGLQVFIADLPLAIGAEWGIAGYGKLGDKTHYITESKTGTTVTNQDYYVAAQDASLTQYKNMSARKFTLDNMVRLRVSYYFNK